MTDEKQAAQGAGRYIWYFKQAQRLQELSANSI